MKRINVEYNGQHYTIPHRALSDVKKEIDDALISGKPHWMTVNSGEGSLQEAELLITQGISISLIGIEPTDPDKTLTGDPVESGNAG